jgi:hypothetical protein
LSSQFLEPEARRFTASSRCASVTVTTWLGDGEAGVVLHLEIRDHFARDVERQVALAVHDGLNLVGGFRQLHFRLVGGLQVAVGEHRTGAVIDRLLHHFGHDRLAIQALQVGHRHLARAEALDLGLGRHLGKAGVRPAWPVRRRSPPP